MILVLCWSSKVRLVFLQMGRTVKGRRGARKHGVEASVNRIKHTLYSLSGECTAVTQRTGRGAASAVCNRSAQQVGTVKHSNVGPEGRPCPCIPVRGLWGADRHPLTFTGTRHILYTAVLPNSHFRISERGGKEELTGCLLTLARKFHSPELKTKGLREI